MHNLFVGYCVHKPEAKDGFKFEGQLPSECAWSGGQPRGISASRHPNFGR